MEAYTHKFGKRLRVARRKAGLTQKELAKAAGTYQEEVSRWENGHKLPSVYTLYKMAKAMNASAGWLVAGGRD